MYAITELNGPLYEINYILHKDPLHEFFTVIPI